MNIPKTVDELYDYTNTAHYEEFAGDDEIELPLSKEEFENLLDVVTKKFYLPKDDELMGSLIRYVHHLPLDVNTTTIDTIGKVLHKFCSNHVSWRIDQEIKARRLIEIEALKAKAEKEKEASPLTLVPDEAQSNSGEPA